MKELKKTCKSFFFNAFDIVHSSCLEHTYFAMAQSPFVDYWGKGTHGRFTCCLWAFRKQLCSSQDSKSSPHGKWLSCSQAVQARLSATHATNFVNENGKMEPASDNVIIETLLENTFYYDYGWLPGCAECTLDCCLDLLMVLDSYLALPYRPLRCLDEEINYLQL